MATLEPELSLAGLEEELSCSICLCIFSNPVTVPCGHNFCASCLELTWAGLSEGFSCPQCRTSFATRPKLHKNTVLCRVVEQLQGRSGAKEQEQEEDEEAAGCKAEEPPVYCDSCRDTPAVQTCLTCTASFCAEHLRPHHESPAFRDHQLCPPLRDLQYRKCPTHNRLLEFFCSKHGTCICSLCLLGHKLCPTTPLEQAKASAQSMLKKKLMELHNQSERAVKAMSTVKTNQSQSAETASRKKDLIRNEFLEIRAMIEERENDIMKAIADEEKRVCNKFDYIYGVLGNKKNEIQSLRDQIEMALRESDDVLFLKRAAALQLISPKEAFVPVVEMDQNVMHSGFMSAVGLKEMLKHQVVQCKEQKAEGAPSQDRFHKEKTLSQAPATPQVEADTKEKKKPAKVDAANITLDYNTAQDNLILSEGYTKVSVSDIPLSHKQHPQRFTEYRQVLGFQCFKRGVHYWEVELQLNTFCAIGVCYGSMARHGLESRLGRNSSSWCIEWLNSRISSWHNDVEKCLPSTKATRIGVLLHCEEGFVIFMAVGEKHNLIYKFKTQFTEALYPAFWLFSSGAVLSLCQMKE
ncbi:tripartite motif containing 25 [Willisornis vidua]|uniref:Tripartite motif containing 25 n=1 Tax=Willisornis vidua TaxID=1566151 RepID=A0ABQ9DLE6_9PASS|nr:tripartite motif containing 25 [Willisornis vidua]